MKPEKIFPTILIIADIGAAVVYFAKTGDYRQVTYWISAAILTASVTF